MNTLLLILFCFIAANLQAVSGNPAIGQPASDSNVPAPKLPTFPSEFSALIEVNIVNKNYTALFKEFYNLEANQGSLERTKDGKTRRSIYDYNLDEKISIDLNAKNCTVYSISGGRGSFNFFGNNNSHIESVSQLFRFAKEYNESYMGVVPVRGIRCNHWRAHIVHNHSSYYLDYYFSVPDWKTTWQNSTVVRAVINGTRSATPHFSAHAFYHVYDFIDFQPGPPDPSNFQLPDGYYCQGLKGENKTVPQVPSAFSLEFEIVASVSSRSSYLNHTVSTWKEVYDFEKKLVLVKYPNRFNPNSGPVLTIHDFNTGIIYNISSNKSGTVCKASFETHDDYFAADGGHHHIRMKTTQELFNIPQRNSSSPLVYKGTASVRGIDADIWVGKFIAMNRKTNKSHEAVAEWYFSKPNWRFMSGPQTDEHNVPVGVNFYSEWGHSVMNLFNFDAKSAETTAFDVKPCFRWDEQRFLQFALNDNYKYDKYATSRQFLIAVTKAISTVANVSLIRVNGIRVQNNRGGMVVTFSLLNKTKPLKGDAEVTVYPEKGLMDALNALKNSVQSGKFKVDFQQEKIYATKSSFYVGFLPSSPSPSGSPVTTSKPSSQGGSKGKTKGVSSGAAAGISFLMLAVGICGGLLIAHVIMKRRGTSLFQYQRQE